MTVSHHSHSGQFCLHAKGTLEQVVQEAIRKGFTTFGLSEHVPRYREQDLYPEEQHLAVEQLTATFEAYLKEAHRLKALYKDKITLLVGLETEYIDDDGLARLEALLAQHGSAIEYLVGSVHHCHEAPIDFDKEQYDAVLNRDMDGRDERAKFSKLFEAYFDAQHTLIQRLRPEIIGHFDLCRLYYPTLDFRDFSEVWVKIRRNVELAISYGALFEVNASAFRKGWGTAYPGAEIFDLILSLGGRFALSDDSHGPQAVGLHYDRAYTYLEERGLDQMWQLCPADPAMAHTSRGVTAVPIEGRPWLNDWAAAFLP